MQRIKNEKGSITVEATIALTTFLFLFITIYSFVTICRAQAKISIAVNGVAKEISQYSYLYAITGLNDTQKALHEDNQNLANDTTSLLDDVSTAFDGIQSLGQTGERMELSVEALSAEWDGIITQLGQSKDAAISAKDKLEKLAEDPKKLVIGIAKLAGSDLFETMKTNVIAEPLARGLVQKNLRFSKDLVADNKEACERYLKSLGIVPKSHNGKLSYLAGLDFSDSTLFQYGSDEIVIKVNYKIKVAQLLPIPMEFHFTQIAKTKGWMGGDGEGSESGQGEEEEVLENLKELGESIWSTGTAKEISELVRSMGIKELKSEGYLGLSKSTYLQLYHPDKNEFVYILPSNQLYGKQSVDEIQTEDITKELEHLKAVMEASTDNIKTVEVKVTKDWETKTETKDCSGKEKVLTVQLVIPEDPGLSEIYQEALESTDMGAVKIELIQSYGTYFREETSDDGGEGN